MKIFEYFSNFTPLFSKNTENILPREMNSMICIGVAVIGFQKSKFSQKNNYSIHIGGGNGTFIWSSNLEF